MVMDFHNRHPLREDLPNRKQQDVVGGQKPQWGWRLLGVVHGNTFSDSKKKVLISGATELCSSPQPVLPARDRGSIHFRNEITFLVGFFFLLDKIYSRCLYLSCIYFSLLLLHFPTFVMNFLVQLMIIIQYLQLAV